MAKHKSALKQHRQEVRRRERNRHHRSRLRTAVKRLRKALEAGEAASAAELLPATLSLVDRTARTGLVHRNAAARTKSRLTRALQRLRQTAAGPSARS